ncbi:Maf family protein [Ovoidimarina sediminis]|uniref:Maf family protein n=1 Tax=Ovoidimarina sediminis TaxID=3079856 RepID=UPI002906745D|nr:Maf family protein [Rhodophyticola sp. MJ-SS7]MDU8942533.1 Maf family protein [Rhodophyticola sp. MJ-SS7]
MVHPLILASGSEIRREMLERNGVACEVHPARIDEETVKAALLADGHKARDVADALAELKAARIAARFPDRLVLGADQVLECDGRLFSKAENRDAAQAQLEELSGKTHLLHSAAVIFEEARPVWRQVSSVRMTMRALSPDRITSYLETAWPRVASSVGCYQIENDGAQLFAQIHGSHFAILGLPLLEVLSYLTLRGETGT